VHVYIVEILRTRLCDAGGLDILLVSTLYSAGGINYYLFLFAVVTVALMLASLLLLSSSGGAVPTFKAPFFASTSAYRRIHCRRGGAPAVWTYRSELTFGFSGRSISGRICTRDRLKKPWRLWRRSWST
jgi:hypothetical protein